MLRLLSRASLAAALIVSACAMFRGGGNPKFTPVSDADYGRLAPGQMAPVDAARGQTFAARDAAARAKLRLEEAQHESELAQAEQTAARADTEHARAEQDAAASSKAPDVLARAQESAVRAELHRRAAQAHAAYAQKLMAARQAEADAADDQVKVRDAELDRSKLTALSQAGIPAATKYSPASFDARVAEAQRKYQEAKARADDAVHQANQTHNDWMALNDQYRQRLQGSAAQTGTGTAQAAPLIPGTAPPQPGEAARAPAQPPPAPPAPQGTATGQ
jgi:hypothetical protein